MQADVKARAVELLKTGAVDRVLGWKAGTFFYDLTPAVFSTTEEAEREFVCFPFSAPIFPNIWLQRAGSREKLPPF